MIENTTQREIEIPDELGVRRLSRLAPRPKCLEDTGLSRELVVDLVTKHILDQGSLSLAKLSSCLCLSGTILETLLGFMRTEALIEVRPNRSDEPGLNYALTDRGRAAALDAMLRSGYIGPAPVTLGHYSIITRAQSIHNQKVSRDSMHRSFENVVIEQSLLDRLGASVNSGRAIFLYGGAGTGKTYISQRLAKLFPDLILIPHAVAVGNNIVQLFDPLLHQAVDKDIGEDSYVLEKGYDRRLNLCERPAVITAGELTADMLEIIYEPATKTFEAPLQMRANNGVFIIDDLGRQQIQPKELFNRWIVPLEERKDYLSLQSGRHFSVPFDTILIFSTNIHPLQLADEAFLRRIGYKIEFTPLSVEAYERLWRDTCIEMEVDYDHTVLDYVMNQLHAHNRVDLLPCHPRDLIGMAIDHALYTENQRFIDIDKMRWAWRNYFVSLKDHHTNKPNTLLGVENHV
ncbi:MAG: AAA family ATPase [Gammaproteobacteria bacterium]|nr:AAA family ATPase [Gammaproteobacteria bacterium]